MKLIQTKDYLLLLDEEAEIKDKEIVTDSYGNVCPFADLSFLGLGYDKTTIHKVVAYYPLTKEAKELDLPLLPNPFGDVSVENLALKAYHIDSMETLDLPPFEDTKNCVEGFIKGYKAAQSKGQFSLEDVKKAIEMAREIKDNEDIFDIDSIRGLTEVCTYGWKERYSTEEIIQSLSTQRVPKEFIPEYDLMNEGYDKPEDYPYQECKVLKTTINSSWKIELVGTYKY